MHKEKWYLSVCGVPVMILKSKVEQTQKILSLELFPYLTNSNSHTNSVCLQDRISEPFGVEGTHCDCFLASQASEVNLHTS